MYSFAIQDFRGFHNQSYVDIQPITILVGENSAGKTSFMAGLSYLLDFISAEGDPSFNKDPFQLGTFEQIAHHRGGRAGRARQFQLRLKQEVLPRRKNASQKLGRTEVEFELVFAMLESQASVSNLNIKTGEGSVHVRVEESDIHVDFLSDHDEALFSIRSDAFRRLVREDISSYWRFFFRDLRLMMNKSYFTRKDPESFPSDVENAISKIADRVYSASFGFRKYVEATSAIRTKPLRTYTPGIEAQDAEGSHVPFELAKLYRSRNKDSWKSMKSSIERFGVSSGMFKEISIKSFGKTVSDPFQIQFSFDGPRTNIVDLGYGTSQILPILYSITRSPKGSRFFIQQPEVHLHPRAQAALGEFFVDNYVNSRIEFVIETHSDFILDRIRHLIRKKRIRRNDVSILFFERSRLENRIYKIKLDDEGSVVDPPSSYRSFFLDEEMKLLDLE